ncbi:MAG: KEOPS complex subunit Cgi121 [Candidatus Diapherotrites archaeon]
MPRKSTPKAKKIFIKEGIADISNAGATIKRLMLCPEKKAFIQLVSLKPVVSREQLLFAFTQALQAQEKKETFSKSLPLEFLLRLSAQKQISAALELFALKEGENKVAVVSDSKKALAWFEKEFSFTEKKGLLAENAEKNFAALKKIYSVGEKELIALNDCANPLSEAVIERIALLGMQG